MDSTPQGRSLERKFVSLFLTIEKESENFKMIHSKTEQKMLANLRLLFIEIFKRNLGHWVSREGQDQEKLAQVRTVKRDGFTSTAIFVF